MLFPVKIGRGRVVCLTALFVEIGRGRELVAMGLGIGLGRGVGRSVWTGTTGLGCGKKPLPG